MSHPPGVEPRDEVETENQRAQPKGRKSSPGSFAIAALHRVINALMRRGLQCASCDFWLGAKPRLGHSGAGTKITAMRHLALLAGLILAGAGCASKNSSHLAQIKPGATRAEVEKLIGKPSDTKSYRGSDYMTYFLERKGQGSIGEYLVRLYDGTVDAVGENSVKGTTEWPPAK
jgi:hypothetical protein